MPLLLCRACAAHVCCAVSIIVTTFDKADPGEVSEDNAAAVTRAEKDQPVSFSFPVWQVHYDLFDLPCSCAQIVALCKEQVQAAPLPEAVGFEQKTANR